MVVETGLPPAGTGNDVVDLIGRHQSSGRALLHRLSGATDPETCASGAWVEGATGRRYLDLGGYGVFLMGHAHPRVVECVTAQLRRLPLSTRTLPTEVTAVAAQALTAVAPPGFSKVLFTNSGAEAVEAAMKLARVVTRRSACAHLEKSFHGKTLAALSITDAPIFRAPVGRLLPSLRLPRSNGARCAELIRRHRPAAVFVEPVQGEGGAYPVPDDVLLAIREACSDTDTLVVADEIQSGFGRCGDRWSHTVSELRPDIMLVGKALGGGVVGVGAVLARHEVFAPFDRDPLLHTSTFAGNPLAAAAVAGSVEVLENENIVDRARRLGCDFASRLDGLVEQFPELFTSWSGRGLLLGLHARRPDIAGEFIREVIRRGVLLTPCLTTPHVVRITPPAILEPADLETATAALFDAADECRTLAPQEVVQCPS